jgi:hypothetical protein
LHPDHKSGLLKIIKGASEENGGTFFFSYEIRDGSTTISHSTHEFEVYFFCALETIAPTTIAIKKEGASTSSLTRYGPIVSISWNTNLNKGTQMNPDIILAMAPFSV